LELYSAHPHHAARSLVLDCSTDLNPEHLREAVGHCLVRHAALCLSFVKTTHGWQSVQTDVGRAIPFTCLDVTAVKAKAEDRAMQAAVADIQAGLNLEMGALLHVAWFKRGGDRPHRLWILVHELASDRQSLAVVLEDLLLAYRDLEKEMAVTSQPATRPFKQWAERLPDIAALPAVRAERSYWQRALQSVAAPLPLDFPDGSNRADSVATVRIAISGRYTQALQEKVSTTGTDIEVFLLAALLVAVGDRTGTRSLTVELEAAGRELVGSADFSRTVGPFNSRFPLTLTANADDSQQAIVRSVADALRAVPHRGVHFGLLRDLDESRDSKLKSDCEYLASSRPICFDYLGALMGDEPSQESSLPSVGLPLTLVPQLCVTRHSPEALRPYVLDIQCYVADGALHFLWHYSASLHSRKTIVRLAEATAKAVQSFAVIADS
ncbi:MAG: condensation domain-containing protein, partial [Cyanobacteria bacterium P01_D01_bin.123]